MLALARLTMTISLLTMGSRPVVSVRYKADKTRRNKAGQYARNNPLGSCTPTFERACPCAPLIAPLPVTFSLPISCAQPTTVRRTRAPTHVPARSLDPQPQIFRPLRLAGRSPRATKLHGGLRPWPTQRKRRKEKKTSRRVPGCA